jgi:TRAP-type C4-dicarboxylate transport system substrate-binding protein
MVYDVLRKSAIAVGMVSLLTTAAAGQTKLNLASGYPPANFHTENLVKFAEEVKAGTGGAVEITVHPNGTLVKAPEIKRGVQGGAVQMGEVLISIHENEDPMFGIDVLPFLATSYKDAKKLYDASRPALEKRLDAQGLKLLYAVAWPPQGIFSKTEINSAADLKGARWRAYNAGTTRIAEIVGAQAVTVQSAELPQALATGVVGVFMSSAATGVDSKVWETLTYYYDTQAWLPKNVVIINKATFQALDKKTQDAILAAAAAAETRGWAVSEEKTKSLTEQMAAKGMKVSAPSAALAADMRKVGEKLTADWIVKAGADGQAVVEAFKK